jgi:polysaccharide pyruvyl transferase WcaK-like protein
MTSEALPKGTLKREHIEKKSRMIGLSVREPGKAAPDLDEKEYHALLANAADFMVDHLDADVILIPMERKTSFDVKHSHAVISQMLLPQRANILKNEYTSGQILSIISHLHFAVGMRLHFLIFAALQQVPFVALPYATKVVGLLDDLDLKMPPLNLVNAGRLIAHIDNAWDNKEELRARVHEKLPLLQERARQTHHILLKLLTDFYQ